MNYSEFIQEAFIKPIRSVLIIDDEFPTIDSLLDCHSDQRNYWETCPAPIKNNASDLLAFTRFCRETNRGWLVDVHDGQNIDVSNEIPIVAHLRERDLLILDYHIDGDGAAPQKAEQILQRLSTSEHFNLVIVYSKDLPQKVFSETALGLLPPKFILTFTADEIQQIEEDLAIWDSEVPDICALLFNSFSVNEYLELIRLDKCHFQNPDVRAFLGATIALIDSKPDEVTSDSQRILEYLIYKFQLGSNMAASRITAICGNSSRGLRWLRSGNAFVVYVQKKQQSSSANLVPLMIAALVEWNPSPNRLILSKFRAALDGRGTMADDYALQHNEMQALWLHDILVAEEPERRSEIVKSVNRYGERLLDAVVPEVVSFADRLVKQLSDQLDKNEIVKRFFHLDIQNATIKEKAMIGHNIYCCSKRPVGGHLTTGHVIFWSENYWVCLSPACDLVPNRGNAAPGSPMRFKAVKLCQHSTDNSALKDKHGGTVFMNIDGVLLHFSYHKGRDGGASPEWLELLALKQGEIDHVSKKIDIACNEWGAESSAFNLRTVPGVVVSQLRY